MNWYSLKKQEELDEFTLELGDILELEEGVFIIVTDFEDDKINGICVLNVPLMGLEESINMLLDSIIEGEEEDKPIYKEIIDYIQQ